MRSTIIVLLWRNMRCVRERVCVCVCNVHPTLIHNIQYNQNWLDFLLETIISYLLGLVVGLLLFVYNCVGCFTI